MHDSAAHAFRPGAYGVGFFMMCVAAWGGVVAFAGPSFDFVIEPTTKSWVWNEAHATLYVAPAVAGVVGALLVLGGPTYAVQRLGALLGVASGIWFVIGPSVEPLWHSSSIAAATVGPSGSTTMRVLEAIGYHFGTGVVMAALAAFALGLCTPPSPDLPRPATSGSPADRQRRFSFRHISHV
jgi:hypothetical protein